MATIKAVSVFQSIKEAFKLDHQIRPPRLTHPGFPIILRPLTMDDEDGWNEVRWRNNDWLAPWESGDPMHGGSIQSEGGSREPGRAECRREGTDSGARSP